MDDLRWHASQGGSLAYAYRPPRESSQPLALLLHGLSGDERSMWALAHALPAPWGILTPRAPYHAAAGGYSWIAEPTAGCDSADLFLPALDPLERLLEMHSVRDLVLMGFSQGAAFALSYRLLGKLAPRAWIVIAGYLPRGSWENLEGMQVFWGHGTRDEWIPLSRARRDVATLRKGGAAVDLCEAPVGHKLGMDCLRGLRRWLARMGLWD